MSSAVLLSPDELVAAVRDARERTFELAADLTDEQWMGPRLAIVNPLGWEIGHAAWFQEKWVLRHAGGQPPLRADADALYDSAAVPHDTRWDLPLPSREETLAYCRAVRDRVLQRISAGDLSEAEIYFIRLAVLHEDMHTEAFTYTRQTLGYPAPRFFYAGDAAQESAAGEPHAGESAPGTGQTLGGGPLPGDVSIPGGTFRLGATPDEPFVFDNEKWAHPVEVKPFAIARAAVSQSEFARFVDDGGYERREWWSEEGWRWREAAGAEHPVYWRRESGGWSRRHFDRWVPLEPHRAALHVNWYEAEAYCRWAGRRLPTEAEWEMAASWDPVTGRKRRYPWGDEPPTPERANLEWRWADPGVETPVGTDEIRRRGLNQSPTHEGGFGTYRPGFQPRGCGCLDVGALPAGDSASGCRQMIGNVWEWTGSDFAPYPGFVVDPYKEYSEPWFYTHKVLRGGCWATRARLIRSAWRNFYRPERRDVWAGFRTCAV